MKILIINYAYFINGGPERYLFHVKKELENMGHEVIPFSMHSVDNFNTDYSKYFASPISANGSWRYSNDYSLKSKIKQIERTFFSIEVYRKLKALIAEETPDIAYVLHYQKKLSPAVILALYFSKVPIVVRISDYLMMCPQAHFFRYNAVCEKCKRSKLFSIKHKCVANSYSASVIWYFAEKFHRLINEQRKISTLVVTNNFMTKKMKEYGNSIKTVEIPTFTTNNESKVKKFSQKISSPVICYVGKITKFKGVDLLLEAFSQYAHYNKNIELIIVGRDEEGIIYENKYSMSSRFTYFEQLEKDDILNIMSRSMYTVLPTRWYENLPNVLLESWSVGTPVITADLGSMKVTVNEGVTGYLFEEYDPKSLQNTIIKGINVLEAEYENMQFACTEIIRKKYSEYPHMDKLVGLFESLIIRR